jgi:hypothetical protein
MGLKHVLRALVIIRVFTLIANEEMLIELLLN